MPSMIGKFEAPFDQWNRPPTWLVPPIGVHRAQLELAQGDVQAATR